ncbi:MAG: AAA family ATPase, partial [Geminicoccaceae bacterium]
AYASLVRSSGKMDHVIAHLPADNVALTNVQSLTEAARKAATLTIVTENRERLAQAVEDRPGRPEAASNPAFWNVSGPALDAVRTAADILAERNSVFSHQDLVQEASRQGLGRTDEAERERAVVALQRTGQLIAREAEVLDRESWRLVPAEGWTSLQAIKDEERLLAAEQRGRGSFAEREIMPRNRASSFVSDTAAKVQAEGGHAWNYQQMTAAVELLSSPDRVTALQGLAGSSKTSTVLVALAEASKEEGHDVRAMAPTTAAARTLGRALKTDEGITLAKHLADTGRVRAEHQKTSPVWIVDEASMASAKDMRNLIRIAEQQNARLFLVLDVLQLGSVGAGRAAGQMIENGMRTAYLDHIHRQGNNLKLRDAVYDMIGERPGRALQRVLDSGGTIIEYGGKEGGRGKQEQQQKQPGPSEIMAKAYLERSPDERAKTLVIDPTRKGVASVTDSIRAGLKRSGELKGSGLDVQVLEEAGLTERERATPTSYRPGQLVRFGHAEIFKSGVVARGSYLEVAEVKGAVVTLKDDKGRNHHWEPRAKSLPVEVYDKKDIDVMVGDKIRWTRNIDSLDVVSGRYAHVVSIDQQRNRIDIQAEKGPQQTIDLGSRENRHFTHGYAVTTRRAQGSTGPVIAHLRSQGVWTVHLASAYTALSRSPDHVTLVTDSVPKLVNALGERDGQQEAALDQVREAAGSAAVKVREMASDRQAALAQDIKSAEAAPVQSTERSLGGPSMER